jgi:bifunctional non-homologous end joining protein LigD
MAPQPVIDLIVALAATGRHLVAPFEQGEIGPDLFRAACRMGLEGLVSKRRDRPYRGGRYPHWRKIKNPQMRRVEDGAW